jgi:putative ABC transport system permease protein
MPADRRGAPQVAVINDAFAHAAFGSGNPVGQRVLIEDDKTAREIVGVVGDIKPGLPSEAGPPQIFLPEAQNPVPVLTVFLRTRRDPALLKTIVGRRVLEVDPDVPAYRVRTAEEIVSRSIARKRFVMEFAAGFAGLSLALALVGIYGVLAYTVAQRTREFGIRMALGARKSQVAAIVLTEGLKVAAAGVSIGVATAIGVMRIISSLLYKVTPYDATVLATIAAVVIAGVTAGCWIPARRASNVDAAAALRWE